MRNLLLISGIFLTFLNITAGASDSSCSELCDKSECEEPAISCDSGVFVKDECDCCDVCLRSLNNICGGLHGRFGICEQGLKCANDNNEAFMNDENTDAEEEDDVIGVCQAIRFYIAVRFTNTYGKDVVLKTSMKSPYDYIDVVSGFTFHRTLDVPSEEDVTFEAFVKDSTERIRINEEEVFAMKPQETPQEATVFKLEENLVTSIFQ